MGNRLARVGRCHGDTESEEMGDIGQGMQMPWKETSPVLERKKFVEEYERGVYSVAELCRRFGISRKTGYKWLKRFDEGGAAELADRGRRPRRSPNAVDPRIAAALLSARKQRPTWGPKKLRAVLAAVSPAAS
jgi:putative transposase